MVKGDEIYDSIEIRPCYVQCKVGRQVINEETNSMAMNVMDTGFPGCGVGKFGVICELKRSSSSSSSLSIIKRS